MSTPVIRQFTVLDRDWVLAQHKAIYMDQHGFDESFEVLVAKIVDHFLQYNDPRVERGWIAEQGGYRLGSVFCMRIDEKCAQLRLFFLVDEARGMGLGHQMATELIQFAKQAGYEEIRLWTHRSHEAACKLYRAMGWRCIKAERTVSFGRDEVVETYSFKL